MGQVQPRRRFPKVSRFLTSKPGVQRRIGLLATWGTSEDCVEAKKIKSSSWSSVPEISEPAGKLDSRKLHTKAIRNLTKPSPNIMKIGIGYPSPIPKLFPKDLWKKITGLAEISDLVKR
ncbi:hypothetical protein U9M48_036829 [Paspalum notatum var. saurae]|uniref:Uncharacterized protein n=1 Tax=Paspalum notatum var. saurae TaxID=547442 RepID=A0AAQ3XAG5_PASNO